MLPAEPTPRFKAILAGVLLVSILIAGYFASVGWGSHISDLHGFRQAQTAISAEYLRRGGPFLSYETPVLGPPWSIPFEFPLYQAVVACLTNLLHGNLIPIGRAVSLMFWAGTLGVVWCILDFAQIRSAHRPAFLCLLLLCPQYLFWSRTFLIETTALFFCALYLLGALSYLRHRSPWILLLGSLAGVLGALVKVTTFPAFALVLLLVFAADARSRAAAPSLPALLRAARRDFVPLLLLLLPALITVICWTHFADSIKEHHPQGYVLTSKGLRDWNFGTLEQRFRLGVWKIFLVDRVRDAIGGVTVAGLALITHVLVGARRRYALIALCGFLTPFLIFTNLFFAHSYYGTANALFLSAAVGFAVVALWEHSAPRFRVAGWVLFVIALGFCLMRYSTNYLPLQAGIAGAKHREKPEFVGSDLVAIGEAVHRLTTPDEICIIYGLDWSAEIPLYAGRRALMIAGWTDARERGASPDTSPVHSLLQNLRPNVPGAVVICGGTRHDTDYLKHIREQFHLTRPPDFENDACAVYDLR